MISKLINIVYINIFLEDFLYIYHLHYYFYIFNYNNNYLLYLIFGFILIGILVYFLKNLITYPLHKIL